MKRLARKDPSVPSKHQVKAYFLLLWAYSRSALHLFFIIWSMITVTHFVYRIHNGGMDSWSFSSKVDESHFIFYILIALILLMPLITYRAIALQQDNEAFQKRVGLPPQTQDTITSLYCVGAYTLCLLVILTAFHLMSIFYASTQGEHASYILATTTWMSKNHLYNLLSLGHIPGLLRTCFFILTTSITTFLTLQLRRRQGPWYLAILCHPLLMINWVYAYTFTHILFGIPLVILTTLCIMSVQRRLKHEA